MQRTETPAQMEAYREYLKLGINRSYDGLRERLVEIWGEKDVPAVSTLRHWGSIFSWAHRAIEDDEFINRRAMDRIRDRLAAENEQRRQRRLALSDIQLNAVTKAMVEKDEDGSAKPKNLLDIHPQVLRALNDTARLAGDTQRLDSGEATVRMAGEEMNLGEQQARVMGEEAVAELARFVGVLEDTGVEHLTEDDLVDLEPEIAEPE